MMKDYEISSPEELDTALAGNAMRRRENLWNIAEGKSSQWTEVFFVIVGGLSLFVGLYGVVYEGELAGILTVVVGITLIGGAMYRRQQAQIEALRELLKLSRQGKT